uniref:Uncharacterized protein n=1 Tax=Arundo donax TaxID=35708 RepID=A0A0A9FAW4_ARUDO
MNSPWQLGESCSFQPSESKHYQQFV